MSDERHARAAELHAAGWGPKKIGLELGVSRNTVARWIDPVRAERDREHARKSKRRVSGTCRTCGKLTGYNGRPGKRVSDECIECLRARQHDERYWTEGRIVEAIAEWARRRGHAPTSTGWRSSVTDPDGYRFPASSTVVLVMGWATAVAAAGLPRPQAGWYSRTEEHLDRLRSPENIARLAEARRNRATPVSVLLDRIRDASVDGVAPPSGGAMVGTYDALKRRGIRWQDACEMAGVRARRPKAQAP